MCGFMLVDARFNPYQHHGRYGGRKNYSSASSTATITDCNFFLSRLGISRCAISSALLSYLSTLCREGSLICLRWPLATLVPCHAPHHGISGLGAQTPPLSISSKCLSNTIMGEPTAMYIRSLLKSIGGGPRAVDVACRSMQPTPPEGRINLGMASLVLNVPIEGQEAADRSSKHGHIRVRHSSDDACDYALESSGSSFYELAQTCDSQWFPSFECLYVGVG